MSEKKNKSMSNRHEKKMSRIHGMMPFDKGSMARGDHLMASLYHKLEIIKKLKSCYQFLKLIRHCLCKKDTKSPRNNVTIPTDATDH
jgi:hypothetical protein